MNNKGQAAVMDALFFMMICSVAATLLFYVSSIYGQSIDQQVSAIYNFEYTGNALIALQGADNYDFWNELKKKVLNKGGSEAKKHIKDNINIWDTLEKSSPSNINFLCFQGTGCEDEFCYPAKVDGKEESSYSIGNYVAYTSSVDIGSGCQAIMKVYY